VLLPDVDHQPQDGKREIRQKPIRGSMLAEKQICQGGKRDKFRVEAFSGSAFNDQDYGS